MPVQDTWVKEKLARIAAAPTTEEMPKPKPADAGAAAEGHKEGKIRPKKEIGRIQLPPPPKAGEK